MAGRGGGLGPIHVKGKKMANMMVAEQNKVAVDALVECIQACHACNYRGCGDNQETAACGRLCADAASVCELTLTLLARGSVWAVPASRLCGDICGSCADECGKCDDAYCMSCAPAVRACADSCVK
jgi:hypothetical protein